MKFDSIHKDSISVDYLNNSERNDKFSSSSNVCVSNLYGFDANQLKFLFKFEENENKSSRTPFSSPEIYSRTRFANNHERHKFSDQKSVTKFDLSNSKCWNFEKLLNSSIFCRYVAVSLTSPRRGPGRNHFWRALSNFVLNISSFDGQRKI